MSLQEKLGQEIKSAMLAKDANRLGALRMLKSSIGYILIERKVESLSDADFIVITQKEIKKRRDSIEQYEKGGRPELAAKEKEEIGVLEGFLPQPLSNEELEKMIRDAIAETGATSKKDMGKVMKAAMERLAGRADGKAIQAAAASLLP